MIVTTRVSYDKRMRRGESPAFYEAQRVGNRIQAHVRLHPVLRKYKDLREGILGHELTEIRAWAGGNTAADRYANRTEPKITKRLGGNKGFWREIERREKARKK